MIPRVPGSAPHPRPAIPYPARVRVRPPPARPAVHRSEPRGRTRVCKPAESRVPGALAVAVGGPRGRPVASATRARFAARRRATHVVASGGAQMHAGMSTSSRARANPRRVVRRRGQPARTESRRATRTNNWRGYTIVALTRARAQRVGGRDGPEAGRGDRVRLTWHRGMQGPHPDSCPRSQPRSCCREPSSSSGWACPVSSVEADGTRGRRLGVGPPIRLRVDARRCWWERRAGDGTQGERAAGALRWWQAQGGRAQSRANGR